jgi:predicted AlkP superfamily pyrophosphatase or phosphodiesterase
MARVGLILVFALSVLFSDGGARQLAAPRVLLISIDGLLPSAYTNPAPPQAPALRALAAESSIADGVVGVLPSVTFPSHTTLVTGVLPAVHGVIDNRIVDPEGASRGAWFWYAAATRVPSLVDAARAQHLVTATINWPVTVGGEADYLVPEFERSPHAEARQMLDALSTPGLLRSVEIARGRPLPWPFDDETRADIAIQVLTVYRPDLTLLHLLAVDGAQHLHGPGSPEAAAAVEDVDRHIARIIEALDRTGLRRTTVVAIVSDHGFLPYERVLNPNALFKQEGLLRVNAAGTIVSWDAYFHTSGGAGFVYLRDPADAPLRDRVAALLSRLTTGPDAPIQNLWSTADLAATGAHPQAAFGLDVKNGWYTSGGHEALVTSVEGTRGGHGYSPERRELYASLILNGPGIPRRTLGIVRMTQIAPTLARVLGITLSGQADQPIVF